MVAEVHHRNQPPTPPPDEGYWAALLEEAEMVMGGLPKEQSDIEEEIFFGLHGQTLPATGTQADWEQVEQVFATDTVVELKVIGYNRGGLLVEWSSLHGFVPASQLLDADLSTGEHPQRPARLTAYVGSQLRLRIIELDRATSRLILSERAAVVPAGTRDDILTALKPGDTCTGLVTNLCHFGVFVDLGGVEGLIHISELSWGRVRHPSDVLERGQTITAHVLDVNAAEGRIALSLKRLQSDPWKTVEQRYTVGQQVSGIVTHVVDFGAFVCVEEGLEGLIHISELAEGQFLHPYNVVSEGDTVTARVLHINGQARRLGLSLR